MADHPGLSWRSVKRLMKFVINGKWRKKDDTLGLHGKMSIPTDFSFTFTTLSVFTVRCRYCMFSRYHRISRYHITHMSSRYHRFSLCDLARSGCGRAGGMGLVGADWGGRDALTLARSQDTAQDLHPPIELAGLFFSAPCPRLNVAVMRGEPGRGDALGTGGGGGQ